MAAERLWAIRNRSRKRAIVFIHGFGGHYEATWGRFPVCVLAEPMFDDYDVYSFGYATGLVFDVPRAWSADPELRTLGVHLQTSMQTLLGDYKHVSIVAHSMGGLVAQRAVLDSAELRQRLERLVLFGTPSAGLRKAGWFKFWKRQVRDLSRDSDFIKALRDGWDALGDHLDFGFAAVAGARDEFVPGESSIEPFAEHHQHVVGGNHIEIVKPDGPMDDSFALLVRVFAGDRTPSSVRNSLDLEASRYQELIERLSPREANLEEREVVTLALSLEGAGRREEAITLLQRRRRAGTDVMGTLAGRYKRLWLAGSGGDNAARALELYGAGLALALSAEDWSQAYYHAINLAFLRRTAEEDEGAAADYARQALEYCDLAVANLQSGEGERWLLATRGEAALVLGDIRQALDWYAQAETVTRDPRELQSMFGQARHHAQLIADEQLRQAVLTALG